MKLFKTLGLALFLASSTILMAGCSGRTADNMHPSGETVEVVIPATDVEQDSVIANGLSESDSIRQ